MIVEDICGVLYYIIMFIAQIPCLVRTIHCVFSPLRRHKYTLDHKIPSIIKHQSLHHIDESSIFPLDHIAKDTHFPFIQPARNIHSPINQGTHAYPHKSPGTLSNTTSSLTPLLFLFQAHFTKPLSVHAHSTFLFANAMQNTTPLTGNSIG